jgi:DME family drug/metabolite transporter
MGASAAAISVLILPFVDVSWLATPSGLTMALWLGFATRAIASVLFTWGLSGLTAATAATLTLGEPLTASILGITVLGERLSLLAILGLVVLVAGLALLAWGSRAPRDPQPYALEG